MREAAAVAVALLGDRDIRTATEVDQVVLSPKLDSMLKVLIRLMFSPMCQGKQECLLIALRGFHFITRLRIRYPCVATEDFVILDAPRDEDRRALAVDSLVKGLGSEAMGGASVLQGQAERAVTEPVGEELHGSVD